MAYIMAPDARFPNRTLRRAPWPGVWAMRLRAVVLGLMPPLLLLALWTIAAERQWMSQQILPDPAYTWGTALDLLRGGDIAGNLRVSLERVVAGLAIGAAIGTGLGVAMGLSARTEAYIGPTIRAICLVPTIGWLPFFMLVFGIGEALKLAVIAKAAFLPMTLSAYTGARSIPTRYIEVARVLDLGFAARLRLVILPCLLPGLATGLRQALSQAWKALIVVEIVASAAGIGHLMQWGRILFQLDTVFVTMAVIGLTGWVMDHSMQWFERRAAHGAVASGEALFRPTERAWRALVLPVVLAALWSGASALGLGNPHILVAPSRVLAGLAEAFGAGDLMSALGSSLGHMAAGWSLGAIGGLLVGTGLGLSRLMSRLAAPSLDGLRQIALFAWIPLLSAWFGDGDGAKIVLVALAAFFPVALGTAAACRNVPLRYREVGRALELSPAATMRRIILPAAAPAIAASLQLALTASWVGAIGAEYLIATGNGLGTFLAAAREANRMDQVIIGILVLGLVGLGMTRGLDYLLQCGRSGRSASPI